MSARLTTAAAQGLHRCPVCELLCHAGGPLESSADRLCCPRCDTPLATHAAARLQHAWAYLSAAAVLYVPANLLPVMTTVRAPQGRESHTIFGGILELWRIGSWELALIVFVASIAVPLLKMVALSLLAFTAQRGSRWAPMERTRLYRVVEAVGHWSMLDVFVVVLLVAMVRFGSIASVQPEPGLLAFGAVVVLTMLATEAFDARLIWTNHPDG
jgi:paraquat-inducible protein A